MVSVRKNFLALFGVAALAIIGLLGLSCYKFLHTYLICIKPVPKWVTINGSAQELSSDGCFILHEIYGAHTIKIMFADGSTKTVVVYPRFADDNSSSLIISKSTVESHGDLRYKVVEQQ